VASHWWKRARLQLAAAGGLVGALALMLAGCSPLSAPTPAPTPSGAYIRLSPTSGPPGTLVTVLGYVPRVRPRQPTSQTTRLASAGTLYFGGTQRGLSISASADEVRWSRRHPGQFAITFQVPLTAWLSPDGVEPLKVGRYRVVAECFRPHPGSCSHHSQATALFRLTAGAPVSSSRPAAHLILSPSQAEAGETVHVTGWAPLTPINHYPAGYAVMWAAGGDFAQVGTVTETSRGELSGSFRVPAAGSPTPSRPGPARVALLYTFGAGSQPRSFQVASARLTVAPSPAWSSLVWGLPIGLSSNQSAFTVAGTRMLLRTATPGTLWATSAHGWVPVTENGAAAEAQQAGLPLDPATDGPNVQSALAVANFPDSYFITLDTYDLAAGGPPPVYYTPFYTDDAGTTWHLLNPPAGFTLKDFAGFHTAAALVWADWATGGRVVSEVANDGGADWQNASMPCPPAGPCLVLGASAALDPGMGIDISQPIWHRSAVSPYSWTTVHRTTYLGQTIQLALYSQDRALVIDRDANAPVQYTVNGGTSWADVSLPAPVRGTVGAGTFQSLRLLSNGALLANVAGPNGQSRGWMELAQGSATWHAVPTTVLPPNAVGITAVADTLWWFIPAAAPDVAPLVESTPIGNL